MTKAITSREKVSPPVKELTPAGSFARKSDQAFLGKSTTLEGNPKLKRFGRWSGVIARHGIALIGVQALGFLSGILIIRRLETTEYAVFTVASSALTTMLMLADSGVTIALTALGGSVWNDPIKLGQLFRTALRFRLKFALLSTVLVIPFLVWLLLKQNVPIFYAAVIVAACAASLFVGFSNDLNAVVLRLHSQLTRIQQIELAGSASRLIFLCLGLMTYPIGAIALFCALPGRILQRTFYGKWCSPYVQSEAKEDRAFASQIRKIVFHMFPNSLYAALGGQVNVWVLSFFGGAREIADIGALGRFAALFAAVTAIQTNVVSPYLAKVQDKSLLGRRFLQLAALGSVPYFLMVPVAAAFPAPILLILGHKYAHLQSELLLMTIAFFFSGVQTTLVTLNSSRGWILPAPITLATGTGVQCLLILTSDLTSVRGVLMMSIKMAIAGVIVVGLFSNYKLRKFRQNVLS